MNRNLIQLGNQLLAIWKQLGLNQRISVVLAAAGVLVGLLALGLWSSRVDYGLLYGKLDDAEAAKVIAVLDEIKIAYKVGQGGGAIYVPRDQVHATRMQLASRGIPRGDGVGFEIFDKPNFGISDFVQRANYVRAVQGELGRTISQLDEVEAARVMIVIPENRLLVDHNRKPTASVFVRVRNNTTLPAQSVNSIRFLVANAVEGLQVGNVSVVDNRGNVLSENTENNSLSGLTANQLAARRNFEQYLAKKAEGMLEAVLGPGQAVVRVAVEINSDSTTRTEEKFDPDGQVPRTTTTEDENVQTTTSSANGGVPGITTNAGLDTNSLAAAPVSNTKTTKKTSQNEYEINKTVSSTTQLAGGIKKLTAAVFVAARSEGTGPNRKITARTPEELDKLRRIVRSALGVESADPTAGNEITLEELPFNDPFTDVTQDLNKEATKQFWWNQVQNLVYPALALALFGTFFALLKRTPSEPLPSPLDIDRNGNGPAAGSRNRDSAPQFAFPNSNRPPPPGLVTVEVFNRLVKENPDNMGQAIQSWLSRGQSKSS
jgi:flagellar M-ring protein FliF